MEHGAFVISLDFELLWGQLDLPNKEAYKENVLGGRVAISKILELFKKYGIHATWAIVGLLALDNKNELIAYLPSKIPNYANKRCSAYEHLEEVGKNEESAPCFFAPSLIKEIQSYENQEIATHTFSHYYCNETGADIDSFRKDLRAAKRVMHEKYGVILNSIVFPRNHALSEYVKVTGEEGIKCWRGNPRGFSLRKNRINQIWNRFQRFLDTYIPIFGHLTSIPIKTDNGVLCTPASRFFRPYNACFSFLEPLKIYRIKKQMEYAAIHKTVFHLWWHPHNFGIHTSQMLKQLEDVLQYYSRLRSMYGMKSINMEELV